MISDIRFNKSSFFSKRKLAKEKFIQWSSSTTCHGFSHLIGASRIILRLMWLVCLLTAIGSCSYLIIKSILEFFKYDVNTKIRTYSEIPSLLPAVTICGTSPIMIDYGYNKIPEFKYNFSTSLTINLIRRSSTFERLKVRQKNKALKNETSSILSNINGNTILHCMSFDFPCSVLDFDFFMIIITATVSALTLI